MYFVIIIHYVDAFNQEGPGLGSEGGREGSLVLALVMFMGYRTRMASVACWILEVSLQNRNPLVINGGDQVCRCSTVRPYRTQKQRREG